MFQGSGLSSSKCLPSLQLMSPIYELVVVAEGAPEDTLRNGSFSSFRWFQRPRFGDALTEGECADILHRLS